MGTAYYIVLERKIDGLDTLMDGKSLSRYIDDLDETARHLGVRPLSEFFSMDPDEALEFMAGEGVNTEDIKLSPLQQFSAQEGLATVNALLTHSHSCAKNVAEDLLECRRILTVADEHGVGWHFEIDI